MSALLQYPDIASYQAGISLAGQQAVCIKATEDGGTQADRYVNPDYPRAVLEADHRGLVRTAYHFLRKDNIALEALFAFHVIGRGVATMIDAEASNADVGDVLDFAGAFHNAGGLPRLVYLPRWYWLDLGSPDLTPLGRAGLGLVSSDYGQPISDTGEGWNPYGGLDPVICQRTDKGTVNGVTCDLNLYRGTAQDLHNYLYGSSTPKPAGPPWPGRMLIVTVPQMYGGDVLLWQQRMQARNWIITPDSFYGPKSQDVCRRFQQDSTEHGWPLLVDGIVGPRTWAASWQRPVSA